jgi:hypothetical protein
MQTSCRPHLRHIFPLRSHTAVPTRCSTWFPQPSTCGDLGILIPTTSAGGQLQAVNPSLAPHRQAVEDLFVVCTLMSDLAAEPSPRAPENATGVGAAGVSAAHSPRPPPSLCEASAGATPTENQLDAQETTQAAGRCISYSSAFKLLLLVSLVAAIVLGLTVGNLDERIGNLLNWLEDHRAPGILIFIAIYAGLTCARLLRLVCARACRVASCVHSPREPIPGAPSVEAVARQHAKWFFYHALGQRKCD